MSISMDVYEISFFYWSDALEGQVIALLQSVVS
ncbi:hypothetical protein protein (plasmid) [Bacillus cereus G9241]|nr:hypothetical protein protein [Bacillus cereus G9241]